MLDSATVAEGCITENTGESFTSHKSAIMDPDESYGFHFRQSKRQMVLQGDVPAYFFYKCCLEGISIGLDIRRPTFV